MHAFSFREGGVQEEEFANNPPGGRRKSAAKGEDAAQAPGVKIFANPEVRDKVHKKIVEDPTKSAILYNETAR